MITQKEHQIQWVRIGPRPFNDEQWEEPRVGKILFFCNNTIENTNGIFFNTGKDDKKY